MNRKLLAGLVAGAAALLAAGPAQAATQHHLYIEPGSSLTIVDDEWGADEVETFDLSNVYLGSFTGTTSSRSFSISRCAGGEVRVVITAVVTNWNSSYTQVMFFADLYEGMTCSNNDLDGGANTGFRMISDPMTSLFVANTDEGGDYAKVRIKIREKLITV